MINKVFVQIKHLATLNFFWRTHVYFPGPLVTLFGISGEVSSGIEPRKNLSKFLKWRNGKKNGNKFESQYTSRPFSEHGQCPHLCLNIVIHFLEYASSTSQVFTSFMENSLRNYLQKCILNGLGYYKHRTVHALFGQISVNTKSLWLLIWTRVVEITLRVLRQFRVNMEFVH